MSRKRKNKVKQIYFLEKALKEAEQELAEMDRKPKLRHGDYGYLTSDNMPRLIHFCEQGSQRLGTTITPEDNRPIYASDTDNCYTILGNIFDDLKRNAKDLTEFEISGQYDRSDRKTFKAHNNYKNGQVWMYIQSSSSYFTIAQAKEIHRKLGQVIATQERKQRAKND